MFEYKISNNLTIALTAFPTVQFFTIVNPTQISFDYSKGGTVCVHSSNSTDSELRCIKMVSFVSSAPLSRTNFTDGVHTLRFQALFSDGFNFNSSATFTVSNATSHTFSSISLNSSEGQIVWSTENTRAVPLALEGATVGFGAGGQPTIFSLGNYPNRSNTLRRLPTSVAHFIDEVLIGNATLAPFNVGGTLRAPFQSFTMRSSSFATPFSQSNLIISDDDSIVCLIYPFILVLFFLSSAYQ